jgi:hypothetical protein
MHNIKLISCEQQLCFSLIVLVLEALMANKKRDMYIIFILHSHANAQTFVVQSTYNK